MANYSKQRELVLNVLNSTTTHPHAEWIYEECKNILPSISRGTVYRNLELLVKRGKAIKVANVADRERYDGTVLPHTHFVCRECNEVIDIKISSELEDLMQREGIRHDCNNYSLTFYGKCDKCKLRNN